jgi:hypothetical protein
MSDDKPIPANDDNIEDAVIVVDEEQSIPQWSSYVEPVVVHVEPEPVRVEPESAPIAEPVLVVEPVLVAEPAEAQVVYVQTPPEPKSRGNRGAGALIALGAGVVFAGVLALATSLIGFFITRSFSFDFLTSAQFYFPVLWFVVAFVLLAVIANRANWWAYIFGSILVAVVVYFATIGLGVLNAGIIQMTPAEAGVLYAQQLANPFIILATLLSREAALWFGALIARRARGVKARNAQAHEEYERTLAEKRAEREYGQRSSF